MESAIALISGLGGALFGAWAALALEKRRFAREGAAIRLAVITDIVHWQDACETAADEGRPIAPLDGSWRWREVSHNLAPHMPRHLYTLTFSLYQEKENSVQAYGGLFSEEELTAPQMISAQFALRRWQTRAETVLDEINGYYGTARWKKWLGLWPNPAGRTPDESQRYYTNIERRVAIALRERWAYDITDDGSLRADLNRWEQVTRPRLDEIEKQRKATNSPGGGAR